jgi:hypothetical protein
MVRPRSTICVMDVISTQRPPGSDQHGAMSFVPAPGRARRADHARTGLGLAVIAATARSAGATYGATNHAGGGADVWISLPTDASDDAQPASAVP